MLVACSVLLAACGADSPTETVEEDRHFANEPAGEERATPTLTPTGIASPIAPETGPLPSPETLLNSRGASDTLYTVRDGNLVALTMRNGTTGTTEIPLPEGWMLVDYEPSPAGDRVAVLMESGSGISLGFFASSGAMTGDPRSLTTGPADSATPGASPVSTPDATPVVSPESAIDPGSYHVTWSPEGTGVLVSSPSQLLRVPVRGEPEAIAIDTEPGVIQQAVWSPQGTEVLLLIEQDNASTRTYLLTLEDRMVRELKALRTTADIRMDSLSWLPDGSSVVFVRSEMTDDIPLHGQIFLYRLGQEVPTLVATSGQGGPSASITQVVPSPDGRSVAYVISIRDVDRWSFHSMWIRSLTDSLSYGVPADNVDLVSQLWWVYDGLAWEQRSTGTDDSGEILFVRQGSGPEVILNANGEAVPIGTPGATPVAVPVGTPHG